MISMITLLEQNTAQLTENIFLAKLHTVQKLRVIFDKLLRTFDCFLSLSDIPISMHKNIKKNNLNEKKIMLLRGVLNPRQLIFHKTIAN